MPKYRLVFDIDGVLADFMAKMIEILGPPTTVEDYSLQNCWPDMDKKTIRNAVEDPDTYKGLSLIPGARKGIKKLDEMGFELYAVTARPTANKGMVKATEDWLDRNFYRCFNKVLVVDYKEKPQVIKDLNPHLAYDDSPYQIKEGRKLGVRVVQFLQPWNMNDKELIGGAVTQNWTHLRKVMEGRA